MLQINVPAHIQRLIRRAIVMLHNEDVNFAESLSVFSLSRLRRIFAPKTISDVELFPFTLIAYLWSIVKELKLSSRW